MDVYELAEQAVAGGAQQKTGEFAVLLALADSLDPKVIVEIGCYNGMTLGAFALLADIAIGIDREQFRKPPGTIVLFRDSHDPTTLDRLRALLDDRPIDFLFIDGDHSYEGVVTDVTTYAPLVREGGLIALHDILPHEGSEVARYWAQVQGIEIVCPPRTWGGIGVIPR